MVLFRHTCFGLSWVPSGEGTVFEIGASLRDVRQRLGLALADVERATKVRERYLRALEEERFDQLPAGGYRFVVTDSYDTGSECLEIVGGWQGTRIPDGVSPGLAATTSPVTVQQEVRLRLLRRVP
jgi:Helix-turn-helix domain